MLGVMHDAGKWIGAHHQAAIAGERPAAPGQQAYPETREREQRHTVRRGLDARRRHAPRSSGKARFGPAL
jgi:hypothetical protein